MAFATEPDVKAMKGEIQRLHASLDEAIDKMRRLDGDKWSNGQDSALASAEKMWAEMKRQAQQVGHEIEERPLVSAVTALGAGIAIGMLFGGRRG